MSHKITNTIELQGNISSLHVYGDNTYQDLTYKLGAKIKLSHNQDLNIYYQKEYHY
jgi:hypothetical protein